MSERESATNNAIELMGVMDPGKKIDTCEEWVRWSFRALCFSVALAGFGKARVVCGRRTAEEQCWLFGKGRTETECLDAGIASMYAEPDEKKVSWLNPNYSQHIKGLAIDIDWSEYAGESLDVVGDIARQLGITWGGGWSVRDYGHFEV